MTSIRTVGWALLAGSLLAGAGCGKKADSLPLVPVGGKVTLDGKPLAEAYVQFVPAGQTQGNGSAANTDAEGRYELIAPNREKGAIVGTYQVVISKLLMPDGSPYKPDPNVAPMDSPARQSLPPRYSDAQQTTLTATVPPAGGTVDFPLESKP